MWVVVVNAVFVTLFTNQICVLPRRTAVCDHKAGSGSFPGGIRIFIAQLFFRSLFLLICTITGGP